MSLHKFQHIPIPFDELQLFSNPQKNQMFLIQTLLFSTKITLYVNKYKYSTLLIITKHNIWFKDEKSEKKKLNIFALPINSLLAVIKSQQHPEIVFLTDNNYDNVRISLSNQQRCNSIISALSFIFTKIIKNSPTLKVVIVKEANLKSWQLKYEQKRKQQKMIQNILSKHLIKQIKYKEIGKEQIYGYLNLENKRVCLVKQIYNSKNHMIHVAKIISSSQQKQFSSISAQIQNKQSKQPNNSSVFTSMQNYYYLHTIEKTSSLIEQLRNYEPLPYENLGEELVYVRQLDYKIQLFFKYLPQVPKEGSPYYNYQLSPQRLFINLIEFYDIILQQSPQTILDFSLLCFEKISTTIQEEASLNGKQNLKTKSNHNKNKRSFTFNEEYNTSFTQIILKLRQFRYQFLLTDKNQLKKLIYQCYYEKDQIVYDPRSWRTKFYHLALILYEFMYGQEYFSTQMDPQSILKIKSQRKVVFPKYLNTQSSFLMSWELQDFIQKSIKVKFKSLEDLYSHPWMKQNVLILSHQRPVRINKEDDKKTDATKSF